VVGGVAPRPKGARRLELPFSFVVVDVFSEQLQGQPRSRADGLSFSEAKHTA
jgi:hypothetical protein